MFIQTETTPNPNAVKFLPGQPVSNRGPVHYFEKSECHDSKLAAKLFNIEGINGVFFGSDFITITKADDEQWDVLKPVITDTIVDYFLSGMSIFDNQDITVKEIDLESLTAQERQIIEIIETRVRPAVAMDGGDIIFREFKNGIVKLELKGACSGCPSSTATLKDGIEMMLKHYVPEVESVEAINM